MTQLTIEQHQMLEQLTGLQYSRKGIVRKVQDRSIEQTLKLGLLLTEREQWCVKQREFWKKRNSEIKLTGNTP
jgi:hypothetical protein